MYRTGRVREIGEENGILWLFIVKVLFFLVSRLSILAQDMGNMQARVEDVNKAVKQLEDSRHPRTKEVKECQARLNKRCVGYSFADPSSKNNFKIR